MKGVGAKTYENYKTKYGKEPTSYALYAAEGSARRHRRASSARRADIDEGAKDSMAKREAVRARPSRRLKNFEGHQRQVELRRERRRRLRHHVRLQGREGGQGPLGCKFQFESILE